MQRAARVPRRASQQIKEFSNSDPCRASSVMFAILVTIKYGAVNFIRHGISKYDAKQPAMLGVPSGR